jgi:hypothetical protein
MHSDDANREPKEKVSLNQLACCAEALANLLYLIEHQRVPRDGPAPHGDRQRMHRAAGGIRSAVAPMTGSPSSLPKRRRRYASVERRAGTSPQMGLPILQIRDRADALFGLNLYSGAIASSDAKG